MVEIFEVEIGEIVKQYDVYVGDLPYIVKGKIVKYKDHYMCRISHYYKPSAEARSMYYPSSITARTLEEAYDSFSAYAESFVSEFEVVPNERY